MVFFIAGSIFAHGDQASQRWKSLTCPNTAAGGAAMAAERVTAKSGGCSATTIAKIARTATKPIRTFLRIERTFDRGFGAAGAGTTMAVLLMGRRAYAPETARSTPSDGLPGRVAVLVLHVHPARALKATRLVFRAAPALPAGDAGTGLGGPAAHREGQQITADVETQGPQLQTEKRNTRGRADLRIRERLVSRVIESNFPNTGSLSHFGLERKTHPSSPTPRARSVSDYPGGGFHHKDTKTTREFSIRTRVRERTLFAGRSARDR